MHSCRSVFFDVVPRLIPTKAAPHRICHGWALHENALALKDKQSLPIPVGDSERTVIPVPFSTISRSSAVGSIGPQKCALHACASVFAHPLVAIFSVRAQREFPDCKHPGLFRSSPRREWSVMRCVFIRPGAYIPTGITPRVDPCLSMLNSCLNCGGHMPSLQRFMRICFLQRSLY